MKERFRQFAQSVATWTGSLTASALAFTLILVWVVLGFVHFGFGEDYQMYVNTGTTIITFLMVFLIQNAQNTGDRATHVKLNELLRAVASANNRIIGVEKRTEDELAQLEHEIEEHRK